MVDFTRICTIVSSLFDAKRTAEGDKPRRCVLRRKSSEKGIPVLCLTQTEIFFTGCHAAADMAF